jgi:hypothetical protein
MRTDILGYEDLHPTEGYQFLPRCVRETPNSVVSSQFPLNKAINDQVHPVTLTEIAPAPVLEPVMPQVKKHRSKLIFDTMVKTRGQQLEYGERKRDYDKTVKIAEGEVERQQMELAKRAALRDREIRECRKRELRDAYHRQFGEQAMSARRERAADDREEAALREYEGCEDRKIAEREARRRKETREFHEEFRRQNGEIVTRKAARKDDEIMADERIGKESAEYAGVRDARAAEDKRRRLEKTQIRERVGERRARELAIIEAQREKNEEAAPSVAMEAQVQRLIALNQKQAEMAEERHQGWLTMQKEKQARKKQGKTKDYPAKREGVDREAFEKRQRKIESYRLQDFLRLQAEEKNLREKRERDEDIEADNEMLDARQRKFEESLRKLHTLVPEGTGLEVPAYIPSRKVTQFF